MEEAKNVVTDFRHKIFDDAFVLGGVICPGNSLGSVLHFGESPLTLFGTRVQRSAPLSRDLEVVGSVPAAASFLVHLCS